MSDDRMTESLRHGDSDAAVIEAERERQSREGIGCLTCGTRFHAPSTDLDGRCPVCKARAERDRLLKIIGRLYMQRSLSGPALRRAIRSAFGEANREQ